MYKLFFVPSLALRKPTHMISASTDTPATPTENQPVMATTPVNNAPTPPRAPQKTSSLPLKM